MKTKLIALVMAALVVSLSLPLTQVGYAQAPTIQITNPRNNDEVREDFDFNIQDNNADTCSYRVKDLGTGYVTQNTRSCSGTFQDSTVRVTVGDNGMCRTHNGGCLLEAIATKSGTTIETRTASVTVVIDTRGCMKVSAVNSQGQSLSGNYEIPVPGYSNLIAVPLGTETENFQETRNLAPVQYPVNVKATGYEEEFTDVTVTSENDPGRCAEKTVRVDPGTCSSSEVCESVQSCSSIHRPGSGTGCVSASGSAGVCCSRPSSGAEAYTTCSPCIQNGGVWCTSGTSGVCRSTSATGNPCPSGYTPTYQCGSSSGSSSTSSENVECSICLSAPDKKFCYNAANPSVGSCKEPNEQCPSDRPQQATGNAGNCPQVSEAVNSIQCNVNCGTRARSGSNIIYSLGYCSATNGIPTRIQSQLPRFGTVSSPQSIGSGGCQTGETCWCVDVTNNPFDITIPQFTNYGGIYVEGPPLKWDDPKAKTSPCVSSGTSECYQVSSASDPGFVCAEADKADIVAQLVPDVVQTGDTITVSGTVAKISEKCQGFKYDCRQQQVVGCNVEPNAYFGLKTKIKAKSCPSGFDELHTEGEVEKWNLGNVIRVFGAIFSPLCTWLGGAGKPNTTTTTTPASTVTPATPIMPIPTPTVPPPTSPGAYVSSETSKIIYSNTNPTGMITGLEILLICQAIGQRINQAANFADAARQTYYPSCFRACGKDVETNPGNAPNCPAEGHYAYVTGFTPASYDCDASATDECGGFGDVDVNIKIVNAQGTTINEVAIKSGADGKFSQSFTVPSAEGKYNAIVTLPNIRGVSA